MAKIGIYGGRFNPPHLGHILAAKEFQRVLGLDLLLFVPVYLPPHKVLPPDTPDATRRLELLRLATQNVRFALVDDLEFRRAGASYTVETLRALKERYPRDKLYLCMGTDMLLSFDSWYHPKEICALAQVVMAHRNDADESTLEDYAHTFKKRYGKAPLFIPNDFLEMSSTAVRRLLILGGAEADLDPKVYRRIHELGLYGVNRNRKNLPFEQLKQESLQLHNESRVNHVIGCSETAVELAKVHGANVEDAARAGILHDVTKALSGADQLRLCETYGIIIDDFLRTHTKLLHAPTAAAVAEHVFGENPAVCEAIRWHTSGRANMSTLEKIIYVADYMEPNRDFPGVEELRRLAYSDLDAALLLGLEMTQEHLAQQHAPMGQASQEAMAFLRQGMKNT